MTTRAILLATIGSLALGTPVRGQTAPEGRPTGLAARYVDPGAGLALDQAIMQALEQEPDLRAVRTGVDAANGALVQAGLSPNPMVSFSQQEEPSGMDNQTRLEVVWPLDLFRKAGRLGVAVREVEATRHLVEDYERLLAADVRVAYGEVAAAARELTVLDDLVAAVSRQHALVAARAGRGAAPPLERDVLRVELQRLEAEQWLQSGAVEGALIALKRVLGVAADASLAIRDDLERLVEQEWAHALPGDSAASVQTRPDVEAARTRVQVADARIERARREGRVDVNLFGMYMRMNSGFPQRAIGIGGGLEPVRGIFHYVAAGATVTMPLRDRNQGGILAARAEREGASARMEAVRLTARSEIATARVRDERARQAAAIYTSDARALARQNLSVVEQTYELGRATVFDVLAERRRYLDIERAFTGALREAYEARQALRLALGEVR